MFEWLKSPKRYYKNYMADEKPSQLNEKLTEVIRSFKPESVFEFGCGTGKNLLLLRNHVPNLSGIELSKKAVERCQEKGLSVIQGDESEVPNQLPVDVAFTCSVLDHIIDIGVIINHLKTLAKKAVVICETNDIVAKYYYHHDYISYGFIPIDYSYSLSKELGGDGATYKIYVWKKLE